MVSNMLLLKISKNFVNYYLRVFYSLFVTPVQKFLAVLSIAYHQCISKNIFVNCSHPTREPIIERSFATTAPRAF